MGAGFGVQNDTFVSVAALLIRKGAVDQDADLLLIQIPQLKNARARDQSLDDFEIWIFGCHADEGYRSILDVRQERVLLCLVPAMDFIHAKDGALIMQPPAFESFLNDLAQICLACQNGRDRNKTALGCIGNDLCEGGFPCAWRPP